MLQAAAVALFQRSELVALSCVPPTTLPTATTVERSDGTGSAGTGCCMVVPWYVPQCWLLVCLNGSGNGIVVCSDAIVRQARSNTSGLIHSCPLHNRIDRVGIDPSPLVGIHASP